MTLTNTQVKKAGKTLAKVLGTSVILVGFSAAAALASCQAYKLNGQKVGPQKSSVAMGIAFAKCSKELRTRGLNGYVKVHNHKYGYTETKRYNFKSSRRVKRSRISKRQSWRQLRAAKRAAKKRARINKRSLSKRRISKRRVSSRSAKKSWKRASRKIRRHTSKKRYSNRRVKSGCSKYWKQKRARIKSGRYYGVR